MLLAGSTPLAPRVWRVMGNLGSRLYFLNMNSPEDSVESLVAQIDSGNWRDKQDRCRDITHELLKTLWNTHPEGVLWDRDRDSMEVKVIVARCARLLSKMRGVINIWKEPIEDGMTTSHTEPIIERPRRINQSLYNLARGHAIINGRNYITEDDLNVIVLTVMNSAQKFRTKLFRGVVGNNGVVTTSDVERILECSKPTAIEEMEKFRLLGIGYISDGSEDEVGRPEKQLSINSEFGWFISDECKRIMGIPISDSQNNSVRDSIPRRLVWPKDDIEY